jgi:predicted nucleic acid-binding protein
MAAIRKVAHLVAPIRTLSVSPDESDNRFLECAEAAGADWLVTGNTRHYPRRHKGTLIVTGRQFLDRVAEPGTHAKPM